jgi:hypothetical protein
VHHRKEAGIGAAALEMGLDIDALEPRIHSLKSPRMIFGPRTRRS